MCWKGAFQLASRKHTRICSGIFVKTYRDFSCHLIMRKSFSVLFLLSWQLLQAQNIVPNASFELLSADCDSTVPAFECLENWYNFSVVSNPSNTPDLCYEGAEFFPPSSINAEDGSNYLGIESSTGNPEYAQAALSVPMQAGITYCVSLYGSVNDQSPVTTSLGIMFSQLPITQSPFLSGQTADVQGEVDFDPNSWTLITGTYTAFGGESFIVVGGFENTGSMPFPYMYIDDISVMAMPELVLENDTLCSGQLLTLSAPYANASYLWSTGDTAPTILVTDTGTYTLERTIGFCTQQASAVISPCDGNQQGGGTNGGAGEGENNAGPFFIPTAFTPDNDGINDVFGVYGPDVQAYDLTIFNRWGEPVFESADISEKWTGSSVGGGYFVPDGVYTYHIKAQISATDIYEASGHVTIVR